MHPFENIRAVTLDFYGTLADHGSCEEIYARFANGYVPADSFCHRFDEEMAAVFDWLTDRSFNDQPEFPTIRLIYREAFRKLFREYRIPADAEQATAVLMHHVARPELFPETMRALTFLRGSFRLCLVTDADEDMISVALRHTGLDIEHVVTSERHRAYKASKASPLFSEALKLLGTHPAETVHIGDRTPDLLGAKWNGLRMIHVARNGGRLNSNSHAPDATVSDLLEAAKLLVRQNVDETTELNI